MKLYKVNNEGRFVSVSAANNRMLVRAQNDGGEGGWEEIHLKYAVMVNPDMENNTIDVTVRVYPGAHWAGIEKLNEEGISDLDIISQSVGEALAEEYPDFDVSSLNIQAISEEGSSIDDTGLAEAAHEYEYNRRDELSDVEDELSDLDDEFDFGPSISSPATAPRGQAPVTPTTTYTPSAAPKSDHGGEMTRENI